MSIYNTVNLHTVYIASTVNYNALNMMIKHFAQRKQQIAYRKHAGKGTTLRRRNTADESAYGETNSALNFLSFIKRVKSEYVLDEPITDEKVLAKSKHMITTKLGEYNLKYWKSLGA